MAWPEHRLNNKATTASPISLAVIVKKPKLTTKIENDKKKKMIQRLKKYRFSALSILLSIVCIIAVIVVNRKIANQYLFSDGKTQALFGINEILIYSYKYYFLILGIVSLMFGLLAIRRKENKIAIIIALLLSILSFLSVTLRIWTLMI